MSGALRDGDVLSIQTLSQMDKTPPASCPRQSLSSTWPPVTHEGRISFEGAACVLHGSEELLSGLGVSARRQQGVTS